MTPDAVRSFIALAREDLEVARSLPTTLARPAAFHLQQAAEKLVKAVLTQEGITFPKGHHIGALAALLPEMHPWRADLVALDALSSFATGLRYPTPGGALPIAPDAQELASAIDRLNSFLESIERWLLRPGLTKAPARRTVEP